MKHKVDIKWLRRFLAMGPHTKIELAEFMHFNDPDSVFHWITAGKLPRNKRRFILKFIKEKLRA